MNFKIDTMTLADLYSIQDILFSEFDDFWTTCAFKQELECENSYFLVAKNEKNEIVGFAGFKEIVDEADIMNIVVKKSCRNCGIGFLLLNNLILKANELNLSCLNLEVNEKNIPAINLYKKFGFKQVGIRKKYYGGVQDGLIMIKKMN